MKYEVEESTIRKVASQHGLDARQTRRVIKYYQGSRRGQEFFYLAQKLKDVINEIDMERRNERDSVQSAAVPCRA